MYKLTAAFLLPTVALGMLTFAVYHLLFAQEAMPQLAPPTRPPSAAYAEKVVGAGIVEPQSESVSLGAAQSGLVLEVFYTSEKVGAHVSAGEPLFRVDDRHLAAQLQVNEANLKAAEAALSKLKQMPRAEDLPPLEAKIRIARGNLNLLKDRYEWVVKFANKDVISREEMSQRKLAYDAAAFEVEQAEAEFARVKAGAWAPDIERAEADVAVARANVQQAQTEIERCLVRAPLDGELLQVNVRPGEYVSGAGGKALMVLGDLRKRHVRVDIDEQDIPRFRSEARAVALARGDAQTEIPLEFLRVEPFVVPKKTLTGDNAERVDTRVLQVIYAVDSAEAQVFVGQQLDVFIELDLKKSSR
jgi:HlyD family secretion protein